MNTTEDYSALKRRDILTPVMTLMNLEDIRRSETGASQTQLSMKLSRAGANSGGASRLGLGWNQPQ